VSVLNTIGNSLTEGFFMFWETLWALVVGFALAGAVQSFVSRAEMQKAMGDHRLRTIVRTSLLGAASSSCSYAASALAKSLFQRGADFTSSMVFMFASTNLVLELGIILWLLMGWQFAAAEFVGGTIMIALFVLLAPRIFPASELEQARARLNSDSAVASHHGMTNAGDMTSESDSDALPLRSRLRRKAGWADAATYTVSDLTMLRRELVIGYLVAGFIAVAVPTEVFTTVFLSGHGIWTDLENVLIGPFIAFISFVCSIGNVPLAAALYQGGISFGGTVAFIFADLIALPLVVIYGKFYGRRLALRLFVSFWAVMSTAGLLTDLLFRAVGIRFPTHKTEIAPTRFAWDYTTFLNLAFLLVAAAIYWTYRNRERLGAGDQYAKDVICGMQVERDNAPATAEHDGQAFYFCSDRCHSKFVKEPDRYASGAATAAMAHDSGGHQDEHTSGAMPDPVCGMTVDQDAAAPTTSFAGQPFWFCASGCRDRFAADPLAFLDSARDPVCGMTVNVDVKSREVTAPRATFADRVYLFCGPGCAHAFEANPKRYLSRSEVRALTAGSPGVPTG
jgi:YHS domain-containing protein/uncharacterized membrane protein YraQ (UPF0718 family)